MGRYTMGKPGCPKCKGEGVFPGTPRTVLRQDGSEVQYPTVVRCSCLEVKVELPDPAPASIDQAQKAAGEKEGD